MSRIRSTFPKRSDRQPAPPAWPEGVIARYLTVAGATVDLTRGVKDHIAYRCTGCGYGSSAFGNFECNVREYAQSHAEVCRALPKPEGV